MEKVYIYLLKDPISQSIRYVGKTLNIKRRYYQHCSYESNKNHRSNWIKHLRSLKLKPIIEVIEECSKEDWHIKEQYWIKHFKDIGYDLTNYTKGGDGYLMSEQSRLNISESKKGKRFKRTKPTIFTEEHKRNLSISSKGKSNMKGKKHKQSWFDKMKKVTDGNIICSVKEGAAIMKVHPSTFRRWMDGININKSNFKYYVQEI